MVFFFLCQNNLLKVDLRPPVATQGMGLPEACTSAQVTWFSADHGQQSHTDWAKSQPASLRIIANLWASSLTSLCLRFSFVKQIHDHLAQRSSESFKRDDNTEPDKEIMFCMHPFPTCPLLSVQCTVPLTPGPSETGRWARATCQHLSAVAMLRTTATSSPPERSSPYFPSSMNPKCLAFSLLCRNTELLLSLPF